MKTLILRMTLILASGLTFAGCPPEEGETPAIENGRPVIKRNGTGVPYIKNTGPIGDEPFSP